MRILADLHIAPRTVAFLRSLGHDVVRVAEVLDPAATDDAIVTRAIAERRAILTQDLDFSALIALSGKNVPSLMTLRLSSSRIEHVNSVLARVLGTIERDVAEGAIITVTNHQVRRRRLPLA